jgi:hypothetical protein
MAIVIEGPCPKCDRPDFWWGKTEEEARDFRLQGCWVCRVIPRIIWAFGTGFTVFFLIYLYQHI